MWHSVAKTKDIEEGKAQIVELNNRQMALFKLQGAFCAIQNNCPHRGGPLGEGEVENGQVTCPWHGWTFDLKSGECISVPGVIQKTFPVKTEGDDILIEC